MPHNPVSLSTYARLLRENRNFRLLWLAQIVSEIGDWLYTVAIYSLLLELTGSAKAISTAVVLQVLPQFFIAPLAGVINDRISRRRVMILADLARAAIVLGMLLVRSRDFVWFLYTLLFLETLMWAFFEPAHNAVIPNLTANEPDTVAANGLSSMTWSVNLALGSSLGGIVAVAFGRSSVFVLNALSFLVSALLIRRMAFAEPHAAAGGPLRWSDIAGSSSFLDGIRYIRGDPRILATMLLKAGLGLLGAHWVILPVFGERVFPVGAGNLDPRRAGMLGMSLLMGARGAGALLGPLVSGYWAGSTLSRLRNGCVAAFLVICVGYLMLAGAPTVWLAAAAILIAHAGGATIWVFSSTLLQLQTDDRYRGRVFSADFGCLVLTMSAVSYLAGLAVDAGVSIRSVAAATGWVALLPAVWWAFALRLWRQERDPPL